MAVQSNVRAPQAALALVASFFVLRVMSHRLDVESLVLANCSGRHGGNSEGYFFRGGRIFSGMLVVEFVLRDEGPEDGGLVRYQRCCR